ncbi:MAG: molybdate ABC transporter substrate-binding protein [Methylophilaceae bacterium]|jgi:molybdate transport system substrate-binding protein|nr:molybdate ABC transporter substrate-binding protein [Methylophilaceae bacterium]
MRLFAAILATCWSLLVHGADDVPLIAAASDLQTALREVAQAFQSDTGQKVEIVFGSSGNMAAQIRQGAPFQMFLSADEKYVLDLAKAGLTRDEGRLYALGRIVLFVPNHSSLKADEQLAGLRSALENSQVERFAIANPSHAPYGRAAREALQKARLWEPLQPKLILGENVSQAAQFATSANASGGIVAYSLALTPAMTKVGRYVLIRQDWHAPLRQRMVLTKKAGPGAEAFYSFLQQDKARAILARNGFAMPQESR